MDIEGLASSLRGLASDRPVRLTAFETIQGLLPGIERVKAAGHKDAVIVAILAEAGFAIRLNTFQQYLSKARRLAKEAAPVEASPELRPLRDRIESLNAETGPMGSWLADRPAPLPMEGTEFEARVRRLGFTQVGFADWAGIGRRSMRRHVADHAPQTLTRLVELLERMRDLDSAGGRDASGNPRAAIVNVIRTVDAGIPPEALARTLEDVAREIRDGRHAR